MKKIYLLGFLLLIQLNSISQNLDLIISTKGDSIACRIDSITDTHIYFEMINYKKWIQTNMVINKVTEYKKNVINKDLYKFKRGTSYIECLVITKSDYSVQNLSHASQKELNLYLLEAKKQKKTGVVLSIIGPGVAVSGLILAVNHMDMFSDEPTDPLLIVGDIMLVGGIVTTIVGLSKLITNSNRINRIEEIKIGSDGTAFFYVSPCTCFNPVIHKYQPGLTLRIRF